MRIRFRRVKDVAARPAHWLIRAGRLLPERLQRSYFKSFGLLGKAYYFTPCSHARRTVGDFCRMTGRSDSQRIYFQIVDNLLFAASGFGRLMSDGTDAVAEMVTFDEASVARLEAVRAQYGAGILLVPHCATSVLSAAGFAKRFPTLVLIRESRNMSRSRLLRRYFDKLGSELLFVRRTDPAIVARTILRALHEKKFVIGTTDLARNAPDTVEVKFFGQGVPLPAWPARFSARRKIPIIPAYIRVSGGRIVPSCGEPYIEQDATVATQRWAGYFEKSIRESPADWAFMLDKHWSSVIAKAAEQKLSALSSQLSVKGRPPNG
jgi:KDO2-lipid IV(A) lauroyltransferase